MTKADLLKDWEKFRADCNKDSGYPNSHVAGLDRGELEDAWKKHFPNDLLPYVEWSMEHGEYVLHIPT